MLRDMIKEYIKINVHDYDDVAILFSGGMDSLSILLSCMDLGIKPHLYTFCLDNYISEDAKRSKEIASIFNLKLTEITIKTDKDDLIRDVKYIIGRFNTNRKTAIQCIYPFLYVIPKIKESNILSGLCADDLYGTSRSMAKLGADYKRFNEVRIKKLNDINSSSYSYIKNIVNEYDKNFFAPYKDCDNISNYMMGLTYKDMNSPKQKNIMYEDYKYELQKYNIYRRNSNLQCNSKIREWHDSLLSDVSINTNNNKSVTAIYNKFYKELNL